MSSPTITRAPVVLVTGAAGGLGRALVTEFHRAGWSVIAAAHRMESWESEQSGGPGIPARQVGAASIATPLNTSLPGEDAQPTESSSSITGGKGARGADEGEPRTHSDASIHFTSLDVTDRAACQTLAKSSVKRFGRIDCLVNNAGLTADDALAKLSDEDWQRVLDVNLKGAFLCSQAVSRPMASARSGHILNIASWAARHGTRGQANYAAAKAGLIGLTHSLARELGTRDVRVNAVLPGVLPTAMTAKLTPEQLADLSSTNVLGRTGTLEEAARFIVFLAGTQHVSGQVFQLDSRIAAWT